jgi:membrane fusion protein, multidrug efflux system
MLGWIERHATRAVIGALAIAFLLYEFSAVFFAYSADAYVTTDVVVIAPEVEGPVSALHVADNQGVAAGAPLLTIDPRPFAIALASAQAHLALAQQQQALATELVAEADADIASRQARLSDAQAMLGRAQPLARDQFVSAQRIDDLRRDMLVAEAELRRAQAAAVVARRQVRVSAAQLGVAQAALDRAQYDMDRTHLVTPYAGRIAPFEARVGNHIAVGQSVLAVVTDRNWRVIANVTERHLPRVAPGQTVLVMLGSDAWRVHVGRVRDFAAAVARTSSGDTSVIPYVDPQTDWVRLPRRFPVEIDVPGLAESIPTFRGGNARILILY